jgi:hypothetical protein
MLSWTPRHRHRITFAVPGGPITLYFTRAEGEPLKMAVDCPADVAIRRDKLVEVLDNEGICLDVARPIEQEPEPCSNPLLRRISPPPSTPISGPSGTPSTSHPTPRSGRIAAMLRRHGDGSPPA